MRKTLFVNRVLCAMALPVLTFACLALRAQTEADALLHSQSSLVGSARALGMGGAFSAVGADISSGALNPAGLAIYRKSEISFTPSFRFVNNTTDYLGTSGEGSRNRFGISSFGVAFYNQRYTWDGRKRRPVEKGLSSFVFSFGFNQMDNYHREINASAFNDLSSFSEAIAANAEGLSVDRLFNEFSIGGLAYNTFVLDTLLNRGGKEYLPAVNNGGIQQTIQIRERGRNNEWYVGLAGNVEDFLYIGASLGIRSIDYRREFVIIEEDTEQLHEFYQNNPDDPDFPLEFPTERIVFNNNYRTTGTGINARLGVILRPIDPLRIGLSFQTPTYHSNTDLFDNQDTRIVHTYSTTGGSETLRDSLGGGEYTYELYTPYVATLGLVFLLKKQGFISADIVYTDYSGAKFKPSLPIEDPGYYDYRQENANIVAAFQPVLTYRVGGEFRYDIFRFRAGFSYSGSPLDDAAASYLDYPSLSARNTLDASSYNFALGFGVRQPKFFLDVSYINQNKKDKLSPYTTTKESVFVPNLINTRTTSMVSTSIGFNF